MFKAYLRKNLTLEHIKDINCFVFVVFIDSGTNLLVDGVCLLFL